ncbi:MAG: homoserine dehydrogenase [Chitinivibrionales bacterium]|nr:homoserine dehydrogenase [Chitinivibrionales bacterium]
MNPIKIGLVGAGTVGGGVIKLLAEKLPFFNNECGLPISLARIADKATARFKDLPVENAICSADAYDVVKDPEIQIVIELIGGTTFARKLILDALKAKKHVVTANKALLAEYGPEIFEAAEKNGVSVYFEASVGGGIPVIKTIREAMIGNNIISLKTIINGTCNYILTQMTEKGLPFDAILKQAQKRGYAEEDPTLDIGGGDSGHKLAIMASLIFSGYVPFSKISIEGITNIAKEDIAFAADMGYCIKLLGVLKRSENDSSIDARVHPAMLPKGHILASVSNVFNAVLLQGDAVGSILLYGRGAGELPTATAVISDIVDASRNIACAMPQRIPMNSYRHDRELSIKSIDTVISRYYLCFWVADKPKVLASIATVLGNWGISIASVRQRESESVARVPVVIISHHAMEKNVRQALSEIEAMDFVKQTTHVIRIED